MELTFEIIVENLKQGKNFTWSRWGDGEFRCLLQTKPGGMNCDAHEYFPDMGERLKEILLSKPPYYLGIQGLAIEQNKDDETFQHLQRINEWSSNELLTRASIKGYLNEFIEALEDKNIVFVGNEFLRKCPVKYSTYIEVPITNCWLEHDRVLGELDVVKQGDVVIFACSMMANVLIDEMYKIHGETITLIDVGSVLEVTVGRAIRTYQKKMLEQ